MHTGRLWLLSTSFASSGAFVGSRYCVRRQQGSLFSSLGCVRETSVREERVTRDERLFRDLVSEAEAIEHSTLLGPAIRAQILGESSLVGVISEVISARLARATSGIMLPRDLLKKACVRSLIDDERPGQDIMAILDRDPAAISCLQTVMFFKGFHAVQAQRVAASFWAMGSMSSKHVALAIQNRVSELWAVDIHPAAQLGGGLLVDHATSVVIGETAKIGSNCTILHGVTLGGTGKERGDRHPKIGNNVVLGAGATVLGNIIVGDGATIGSQAVVTKEVPPGMTCVGLNKLLDPNISFNRRETVKKREETWQYEVAGYEI
uniref:serine O-acetyltransferase n=1 Tax=Aureoumbra lagunensis TaxID=44058 RepID=A0A7S3JTH5_9STRA